MWALPDPPTLVFFCHPHRNNYKQNAQANPAPYIQGRNMNRNLDSMPNMTGRPGYRTMEMNGGSSAPYLARTPCIPLFVHCLIRVEAEGLLDYQGRAGDHFYCTVEPSLGHIWVEFWRLPSRDLPFLVFFENNKESFLGNHQKSKGFFFFFIFPCRTPKIPGKEGKHAQKSKEIPCRREKQGIPKKKARKERSGGHSFASYMGLGFQNEAH